jgi:signal transduction histidine kinase
VSELPEAFSPLNLYNVLHSLPEGVTLADVDGRIVFSNDAADRILGVGVPPDAVPEQWAEHYGVFRADGVTPFSAGEYPLVRALAGETPRDVEMLIRNPARPEGAVISVSGRPLFDVERKIIGAAVVFRDVTRLRRMQTELEEKVQELRAAQAGKDELVAFVVHDLKGPLTAITTICELLTRDALHETDQVLEDVQAIKESAWRLNRMVIDLLDIQMAQDGALEPAWKDVDLHELMAEVVRAVSSRSTTSPGRIAFDVPKPLMLRGDRSLLFRLLMNLVDNCIKYGPPEGEIRLSGRASGDGGVLLSVRDQGPGVPEALRERIFEKYSLVERDDGRRAEDSRGLGLRFCHVVAEAHGGRIWVEDAEPSGARFCVDLPPAWD